MAYYWHPTNKTVQDIPDDAIAGYFAALKTTPGANDKGKVLDFVYSDLVGHYARLSEAKKSDFLKALNIPPGITETRINEIIASSIAGSVGDVVGVLNLTDLDYAFHNNKIYGLKRLTTAEAGCNFSYIDRVGVAPITAPYAAFNGTGESNFWSASGQWLEVRFGKNLNVWKVALTHRNNDYYDRYAKVGSVQYSLNPTVGTWTHLWKSADKKGYSTVSSVRYDEWNTRSIINNWQVMVSDNRVPVCSNGYVLKVGDKFRLTSSQGYSTLVAYQGFDPLSGAWYAELVPTLYPSDTQPIAGSTNPIQSTAVLKVQTDIYAALDKLKAELLEAGKDLYKVGTVEERDAIGARANGKYIQVGTDSEWILYRGELVYTDDPAIAPVMQWEEILDSDGNGTIDLTSVLGQITIINEKFNRLESELTEWTSNQMLVNELILDQINRLRGTQAAIDIAPLVSRIEALESRPVVPETLASRIAALESRPLAPDDLQAQLEAIRSVNATQNGWFREETRDPNDSDDSAPWKIWSSRVADPAIAGNTLIKVWSRFNAISSAVLLQEISVKIEPSHSNATALGNNKFRNTIAPGSVLEYSTVPTQRITSPFAYAVADFNLSFPANIYNNVRFIGLDAGKAEMNGFNGGGDVPANGTSFFLSALISRDPDKVSFIRIQLRKLNNELITYDYPIN
jgi:hypothetical protein